MTYYAITKGTYSDYHICSITSDKEKAKRLRKIYSDDYEEAEIEEYDEEDGKDTRERKTYYYRIADDSVWESDFEGTSREYVSVDGVKDVIKGVRVIATDEEHARKKAQDMIARFKAMQAGL